MEDTKTADSDPFDMFREWIESWFWSRDLKRVCGYLHISPPEVKSYLKTQRDLLNSVNKQALEKQTEKNQSLEDGMFPTIIRHRLYELHVEFLPAISTNFKHSVNGLVRQVIELYILTLYCRFQPIYKKSLIEPKDEKFDKVRQKVEEIKRSKIDIPYIAEDISKDQFLDGVYTNFSFYSNVFHSCPHSLSKDVLHLHNDDGETAVGVPAKDWPADSEEAAFALYTFYAYTHAILRELTM